MTHTLLRWFSRIAGVLLALALAACAHPISMSPDLAAVKADGSATLINKSVGYHIPDAARALEVTTAGGGGDKVRYFPYRDLEPGLYKALGERFRVVTRIANPTDAAAVAASGIQLLITPEIRTVSSSDSLLTWPPTQFTVDLTCTVADARGQTVDVIRVSGYGRAEFDEFKTNFSLAAVRASNHALSLLVKALGDSAKLRD